MSFIAHQITNQNLVLLGLGSNLGARSSYLKEALKRLAMGPSPILKNSVLSPVYESKALLPDEADAKWDLPYLNCVLAGETTLPPEILLTQIQKIEESLGRKRHLKWQPREIDIDILYFKGQTLSTKGLTLPHSDFLNRAFTLLPATDLFPHLHLNGIPLHIHLQNLKQKIGVENIHRDLNEERRIRFPLLMAILNCTPDSFSDGGKFLKIDHAKEEILKLVASGVDVIDIGAESTRPGAEAVTPKVEWERIGPILNYASSLKKEYPFKLSLDSRNPETLERALEFEIDFINDVTGFKNESMLEIAKSTSQKLIFMHSLSVPVVKGETLPAEKSAVELLLKWLQEKKTAFFEKGIDPDRLVFDPGIGFGKTPKQNWEILRDVDQFCKFETPILIGHSRKSFLNTITEKEFAERDPETLAISSHLAHKGVDFLRVHNFELHRDFFNTLLCL